jgi:murein DD-endopeptidase MepM/ murein hydrolase activator NlpD
LRCFFYLSQKLYTMKFLHALLIFCTPIFAQSNYPQDFFRPPLNIPMQLAGNFGELRPNHFHAGFDFKTQQKEGLPIFAAGDGYVSRIKISTYGYGKAIYVTHPNGYTTVYGHLQKAYGVIQDYIRKEHYQQQAFEIELFPSPNEIPVKSGDTIAISGNTGGSEGPHLHFEIRDSQSEKTINPLFFGFDKFLADTKKPLVSSILVYPIDSTSIANQSRRPIVLNLSLQKDGSYIAEKVFAKGNIGFGIICSDFDNVSYNTNGVYKVETFSNGVSTFGYQFDALVFDEGRYINALIDFPRYKQTKQRVQKLFMKAPFALSNINTFGTRGILEVLPNFSQLYRIEISDFTGNKVGISIPIEYATQTSVINDGKLKTPFFLNASTDNIYEKDGMEVFFPAHTFYDDFYLKFDVTNKIMTVHDDYIPVHSNFRVSIKDSTVVNKEKTFIASIDGSRKKYNNTKFINNTFSTFTKNLGQFVLALDTIAPKIVSMKPIEGKLLKDKYLVFKITDDLSGIKSFSGFVNEKWVLFEYDAKTNRIIYEMNDNEMLEGKNDLKLIVSDNLGNSAIFETSFFRSKPKLN